MADLPAGPLGSNRVIIVVGIVIVLAVTSVVVYLQTGNQPSTTSDLPSIGTTTTTVTFPCSSAFTTQTITNTTNNAGESNNGGLDFSPLLGNFSAVTMVEYGNGSEGRSFTSSSVAVLSRRSTPSGPIYEVNVTTMSIAPVNLAYLTQNTETTITSSGNITRIGSVLADLASNGSVVSMIRSTGNLSGLPLSLWYGVSLFSQNYSFSNSRTISTSTDTIGTTRMSVTNMGLPTLVTVVVQQGCGQQAATTTKETISNRDVQFGMVPGTDFALVTRSSQVYSIQWNSTASSEFSLTEEVTGFTVA